MYIYLMERRFLGLGLLGSILLVITLQVVILSWMARAGHIDPGLSFHIHLNAVLAIIWLLVLKGDFKVGISKGVAYRRERIDQDLPGSVHVIFKLKVPDAYDREQFIHWVFRWWSFVPAGAGQDAGKSEWFKFNVFVLTAASLLVVWFAFQRVATIGIFSLVSIVLLINYT